MSRVLYQGRWPDNLRAKNRFYKAIWFPEESTAVLYEHSTSSFKVDVKAKRLHVTPTPGAGAKWEEWGTYKLVDFHGDMKDLLRTLRTDIRYESRGSDEKKQMREQREVRRSTQVALMGRAKAIAKFSRKIRLAERLATKVIQSPSSAGAYAMFRKASRASDDAMYMLDGFSDDDSDRAHMRKDWMMVGRLVGKAERALGIGGGDGEDNRDPHQRFRTSKFSGRVPQRKPDRCFVYFNGKSFSVTAAWGFRRVTARFKKQADATRFAKSLKCRIVKGSEYSRMPKALRAAVQANVPVIMKREKFPRDQAFAAAISMALRGTIKPLKKSARLRKSRARISSKRKKR